MGLLRINLSGPVFIFNWDCRLSRDGVGGLASELTLGDGHLVEFDVVHHRPDLPMLQHRISRHFTEVYHAWGDRRCRFSV